MTARGLLTEGRAARRVGRLHRPECLQTNGLRKSRVRRLRVRTIALRQRVVQCVRGNRQVKNAFRIAIVLGGAIFMFYASYALLTLTVTGVRHPLVGALGGVCFLVACGGVGIALDWLSSGANE